MARHVNRLTAKAVDKMTAPGRHPDGGNLYLSISDNGGKRWVLFYRFKGKMREMGLGSARTVSLADARRAAANGRASLAAGIDPLSARKRATGGTFEQCARDYIDAQRSGWRNAKHGDQWLSTLKTYAFPTIGSEKVSSIDTESLKQILTPIWSTKNETASRVRGRIEAVLDWSRVQGMREGENPARWKGHLDKLLPKRSSVRKVRHHPALPFGQVPEFMRSLAGQDGVAAHSLAFTILTATRTNEVTGFRYTEIEGTLWTVPSERMKGGRIHRVPLSAAALAVIEAVADLRSGPDGYVFPGGKEGKPQSNNAILALLDRMGMGSVTVHGFRSSFKDWAAECTAYPGDLSEMALAHVIEGETEAAYAVPGWSV